MQTWQEREKECQGGGREVESLNAAKSLLQLQIGRFIRTSYSCS